MEGKKSFQTTFATRKSFQLKNNIMPSQNAMEFYMGRGRGRMGQLSPHQLPHIYKKLTLSKTISANERDGLNIWWRAPDDVNVVKSMLFLIYANGVFRVSQINL